MGKNSSNKSEKNANLTNGYKVYFDNFDEGNGFLGVVTSLLILLVIYIDAVVCNGTISRGITLLRNIHLSIGYVLFFLVLLFSFKKIKYKFFRVNIFLQGMVYLFLGNSLMFVAIIKPLTSYGDTARAERDLLLQLLTLAIVVGFRLVIVYLQCEKNKKVSSGFRSVSYIILSGIVLFNITKIIPYYELYNEMYYLLAGLGIVGFAPHHYLAYLYCAIRNPGNCLVALKERAEKNEKSRLKRKKVQKEKDNKPPKKEKELKAFKKRLRNKKLNRVLFVIDGILIITCSLFYYNVELTNAQKRLDSYSKSEIMLVKMEQIRRDHNYMRPVVELPYASYRVSEKDVIPKPDKDFYVYDELEVLTSAQKRKILDENQERENKRESIQVVVALVESSGNSMEIFSTKLFNEWGIGGNETQDGVLIVLAQNDGHNNARIEVGYGLEDKLTDSLCGNLLQENKFLIKSDKKKEIAKGIINVFNGVNQIIDEGSYQQTSKMQEVAEKEASIDYVRRNLPSIFIILLIATLIIESIHLFINYFISDKNNSGGSNNGSSRHNGGGGSSFGGSSSGGSTGGGGSSGGAGASI